MIKMTAGSLGFAIPSLFLPFLLTYFAFATHEGQAKLIAVSADTAAADQFAESLGDLMGSIHDLDLHGEPEEKLEGGQIILTQAEALYENVEALDAEAKERFDLDGKSREIKYFVKNADRISSKLSSADQEKMKLIIVNFEKLVSGWTDGKRQRMEQKVKQREQKLAAVGPQ